MTPAERLRALPRIDLGHWPTPLQRLDRFSEALGVEVWCKRDDIGSVALAGNKVRKYELVLGRARAEGADTLVTTGGLQSNSARAGAAAAAAVGMDRILVLSSAPPETASANLLLDRLLGAELHFLPGASWRELDDQVDRIADGLRSQGRRPVAAPVGCSSPLGALGFALAFGELDRQLTEQAIDPTAIVHASSSGGTHAGLVVGRALHRRDLRLIAVDVAAMYADPATAHLELAAGAGRVIGLDLGLGPTDIEVVRDQIGDGYARPTALATECIELLARTEAVITDPVYSGKGLAGLVALVRRGDIDGPIVFWHTGGYHALFDPALAVGHTSP